MIYIHKTIAKLIADSYGAEVRSGFALSRRVAPASYYLHLRRASCNYTLHTHKYRNMIDTPHSILQVSRCDVQSSAD